MIRDYLQAALQTFNGGNWYGWRKLDDDGNKIPDNQRMTYENVIVIKDGAVKPSKEDVDAKIQELKDEETSEVNNRASGKTKLKNLGLTDDEIKALIGV